MLRTTADWRLVKGLVVPRSSDTVVALAGAAAGTAFTGAEAAVTGAGVDTGANTGAAPLPAARASTSAAVMRPLGPVPTTVARSTWDCGARNIAGPDKKCCRYEVLLGAKPFTQCKAKDDRTQRIIT